jgi:hypothetical protein
MTALTPLQRGGGGPAGDASGKRIQPSASSPAHTAAITGIRRLPAVNRARRIATTIDWQRTASMANRAGTRSTSNPGSRMNQA